MLGIFCVARICGTLSSYCLSLHDCKQASWLQAQNKEFTVNIINECAGFYKALKSGKTENKGLELA